MIVIVYFAFHFYYAVAYRTLLACAIMMSDCMGFALVYSFGNKYWDEKYICGADIETTLCDISKGVTRASTPTLQLFPNNNMSHKAHVRFSLFYFIFVMLRFQYFKWIYSADIADVLINSFTGIGNVFRMPQCPWIDSGTCRGFNPVNPVPLW